MAPYRAGNQTEWMCRAEDLQSAYPFPWSRLSCSPGNACWSCNLGGNNEWGKGWGQWTVKPVISNTAGDKKWGLVTGSKKLTNKQTNKNLIK